MFQWLRKRYEHPRNAPVAQYYSGQDFDPGAASEVYEPKFGLPIHTVRGFGVLAGPSPHPLAGPQIYAGNPKPVAGLGGPIAGTMWTQSLSDNENG
jgi:hypothetical protein